MLTQSAKTRAAAAILGRGLLTLSAVRLGRELDTFVNLGEREIDLDFRERHAGIPTLVHLADKSLLGPPVHHHCRRLLLDERVNAQRRNGQVGVQLLTLIDPARPVARELRRRLQLSGLLAPDSRRGTVAFWTTGVSSRIGALIGQLWGEEVDVHTFPDLTTARSATVHREV